jgi:hypothetical protein
MRLSLAVNGISRLVASVAGAGYLNAHLNMQDRPKDNVRSSKMCVVGTDVSSDIENIRLKWPELDLKVGDVVELRVLPEGEGNPPSEVRKSSEAPSNLFLSSELAREMVKIVSDFDTRIMELVSKSEKSEPADEHKKFIHAVGRVIVEVGDRFLYPVYRRHKELVPDDLKGELL